MKKLTLAHRKSLSIAAKNKFKNGFVHPMLGKHHSQATKDKLKEYNLLGVIGNKGGTLSKKTRNKISKSRKGIIFSKEHIENLRKSHLGNRQSEEAKKKISEAMKESQKGEGNTMFGRKGHLSPRWKGGVTALNEILRGSLEYRVWRTSVFERDGYACVWCGDNKSGNLNADHIKPWAFFPELRFELSNGRTLCVECHRKTDTYGYKLLMKDNDCFLQTNEYSQH